MAVEVLLPKMGFSMNGGTLAEWLVPDGSQVKEGSRFRYPSLYKAGQWTLMGECAE